MATVFLSLLCLLWLQACSVLSILLPHDAAQQSLSIEHLRQEAHQSATAAASYSNDWVVQVEGTLESVDLIASSNGFISMGQVSYNYKLPIIVS